MRSGPGHQSVDEFLSAFPPLIQAIAQRVRHIVDEAVPGMIERVYPGWRLIGYRVIQDDRDYYFCFIAPSAEKVVVGFEFGRLLSDPGSVLTGSGKQVRQVEIRSLEDVGAKVKKEMIFEAAQIAISRARR